MNAYTAGLRRPCLRLVVTGRLVLGPRTDWRGWRPVAEASAGRMLALDVRAVSQIDAAGLGLLVALSADVRRHGGRLRLLHANQYVSTLVRATGLSGALGLVSDAAETRARRRRGPFGREKVKGQRARRRAEYPSNEASGPS